MRTHLYGCVGGLLLFITMGNAQTTWTTPPTIMFPATSVGSSRDTSFMVYAGGLTYNTNYRFYVTPSAGFQVSWSPAGPFQSSLMLQWGTYTGYQSWCYLRYTPTSPNMVGTVTLSLTYGHPTYALIHEWRMGLNQVVPVQLASFTASVAKDRNAVVLAWQTLSETANYGFEVERKGEYENTFSALPGGFVPGHGTILEPQSYAFTDEQPLPGTSQYRLKQIDLDGTFQYSDAVQVQVATEVGREESIPAAPGLMQNYPNPFNPSTTIRYSLPVKAAVQLRVYDMLGMEVAVLLNGEREAGYHEVVFDARGLPGGVYFYRLQTGSFSETRRLLLVR